MNVSNFPISEYKKASDYLTCYLQLSAVDMSRVRSFHMSERCLKDKKKLLDIVVGNRAALDHYITHRRSVIRGEVARSLIRQYFDVEADLISHIERLEQLLIQHRRSVTDCVPAEMPY